MNMTGTLGRKMSFSAFVVVGNKNGVAGKQFAYFGWVIDVLSFIVVERTGIKSHSLVFMRL